MQFLGHPAASVALCLTLFAAACSGSTDTIDTAFEVAPSPTTAIAEVATTPPVPEAAGAAPQADAPAEETQTEPAAPTAEPAAATAVSVELPAVEVYDLSTGAIASLDSFARPGPTLVWFWAPH